MKSYCKGLVIDGLLVAEAYAQWSRGAAGRKNAVRVTEEHGSAAELVAEIVGEIASRTLRFRPIRRYMHTEPMSGKRRLIGVQSVKQQVCDYVAVLALEPLLNARVGFYQVSSVKGKGQLFAARTVRRWSQDGGYWVHVDVRKCYPSISHEVVMGILSRYVRSPDVLYLARALLATHREGLDIGSYFSLRIAQLVLSFGYHHVEDLAKVRRGRRVPLVEHQLWYMDDVYLLGRDKRNLRTATRSLERFLARDLGLALKPWKVARVGDAEPIDVAGFVVRPGRVTVRASIFLRARRAFRRVDEEPSVTAARRACAYWGWIVNSDSALFVARNDVARIVREARRLVSDAGKEVG